MDLHGCVYRKQNYYNDITLNNLAMIATLKEEIKEKEQKIERYIDVIFLDKISRLELYF